MNGNRGHDTLWGGAGADWLWGGQGDDWLEGGADGDILWGGYGDDTLIGGLGANHFGLGRGTATILDFEVGVDCLVLPSGLDFSALTLTAIEDTLTLAFNDTILAQLSSLTTTDLTADDFIGA
jgi:Ca2+-binding RTX toxin-like protein